jgi:tetratricopeptide (TPR) repeat protein
MLAGILGLCAVGCNSTPSLSDADAETRAVTRTVHFRRGRDLARRVRYKEAIEEFREAVRWVPNDRQSYLYLGWSLFMVGLSTHRDANTDKGLSHGKKWDGDIKKWEDDPDNKLSKEERARLSTSSDEKYRKARHYFEQGRVAAQKALAIRADPDVYQVLVWINIYLDRISHAKDALNQVIENSAVDVDIRERYKKVLEDLSRMENEIEERKGTSKISDEFGEEDIDFSP